MSCYVRPMCKEDVPQVKEIDREAFPTQFPAPDYQRELQDRISHHIVACDEVRIMPAVKAEEKGFLKFVRRIMQLFGGTHPDDNRPVELERVLGFASIWVMADEAHLTNIAVRLSHRRQGIGELLLISIIELAAELKADFLTLEVRASNIPAQELYKKYGFTQVGLRRGYYTDNREDAVVMSTESLSSPSFRERFPQLKEAYLRRYGSLNSLSLWNKNRYVSAKPPPSA